MEFILFDTLYYSVYLQKIKQNIVCKLEFALWNTGVSQVSLSNVG